MRSHETPFLAPPEGFDDFESASVVIVPFPYEGGVSYGRGAGQAPQAVLEASQQLEFYDEILDTEPYRVGIATMPSPRAPDDPTRMIALLKKVTGQLLDQGKFVVVIGGDHSISSAYFEALAARGPAPGVVQLDAHADLRDTYQGSPLSHACVMARIRDKTRRTLQVGIRSLSRPEAELIRNEGLNVAFMHQMRGAGCDFESMLDQLPHDVFLTIDVDVFDWSVIRSTGTPEPGGMLWDEAMAFLTLLFTRKNVVGFDVVELSFNADDPNSAFAVAKLIYRLIGLKFRA